MQLGATLFRPSTLTPGDFPTTVKVAPSGVTSPATTFQPATPPKTGFASFVENLPNLFLGFTQVTLAQKIAKINLERVRQGLPPLDAAQTAAIAPRPGVAVGLSPDVKNIIVIGGLGIGALILFGMMRPKRKR